MTAELGNGLHDVQEAGESPTHLLLDTIRQAHEQYLNSGESGGVLTFLLDSLVALTGSGYGFLEEVLRDENGAIYKRNLALSNISWDDESKKLYDELVSRKLEFRQSNNLAGAPAFSGKLIIANNAAEDERAGGLPKGHPLISSYMGIPLYFGGELLGVAGIANRPGGYNESLAAWLSPFLSTCASIIHAIRQRRREAEYQRELAHSASMLSAALDVSLDSSFLIDVSGVVLDGNDQFACRLGRKREELIGKNAYDLLPPDLAATRQRRAQEVIREKRPVRFEDGKDDRIFSNHLFPVFDEQGEVVKIAILSVDITEKRQAEEAVRKSEERHKLLIETTQEGVWAMDRNSRTSYVNRQMAEMLGYTCEEMVGLPVFDFMPQEELRDHAKKMEIRREGKHSLYERSFFCRDGRRLTCLVSATALSDAQGQFDGSIAFFTDITLLKRSEQQMRAFAEVVDSAPNSVTIHDYDGNCIYANSKTYELHQYTPEEFMAIRLPDLNAPESAELIRRRVRSLMEKNEATFEVGHYRKDGSIVPLEVTAKALDWMGRPCILSIGRDISERKLAEQALRESEGQVRAKLEAMLMPDGDIGKLKLSDIIDIPAIQAIMDDFASLSKTSIALVDLEGKVLISTGWQDICTKFHRVHPGTCQNCVESDTLLSAGVQPGMFKAYKCKNNMWDIATPAPGGRAAPGKSLRRTILLRRRNAGLRNIPRSGPPLRVQRRRLHERPQSRSALEPRNGAKRDALLRPLRAADLDLELQ